MIKLIFAPNACSLGIHILLEEIGKPYTLQRVSLKDGEHLQEPFKSINPKGRVPALVRDDGSVLTEFQAIAWWLARSHPETALLPKEPEGEARVLEAMDYIVGTMHMQAYRRIARPETYAGVNPEAIKQQGKEMLLESLALFDDALNGKPYIAGTFSIADAALFFVEYWVAALRKFDLPPNCSSHYRRMLDRPSVQRMMDQEGSRI